MTNSDPPQPARKWPTRGGHAGTVGIHLRGWRFAAGPGAFMIDQEFADVHRGEDSSKHLMLPVPAHSRVTG